MSLPGEAELMERAVIRKLTLRVVSFSWLLFFVSWLDRANIGYASLSMNQDLGFSNAVYGLGAGLFFGGYAAFQLPSNLILYKVGPRRWLAALMVTWGLISASFSLVTSPNWFYVLRFAMGAAEAGALPGLMVYLIRWFPARYRGVAIGNLLTAAMVALIVMGPLSTQLIRALNGVGRLARVAVDVRDRSRTSSVVRHCQSLAASRPDIGGALAEPW